MCALPAALCLRRSQIRQPQICRSSERYWMASLPALVLAPDQRLWMFAEFTPNGRWLARTTSEGVVFLADLPEVFRRMERWGSAPRR